MTRDSGMGVAMSPAVAALSARLRQWEHGERAGPSRLSSGCPPLDERLPGKGLRAGCLVEWLAAAPGAGASTLALLAARSACQAGRWLVVLDRAGEFYPPAAAALGVPLERLLLVHPAHDQDERWALDEALRCPAVGAVLAWIDRLPDRLFRRLQLAAEAGGGLGCLVRPLAAQAEPSWAELRLLVSPRPSAGDGSPRRLGLRVLRGRGVLHEWDLELELHDDTGDVRLAAALASATTDRRATGT